MIDIEEGRACIRRIQRDGPLFLCGRASWMTDDQYRQLRQFADGKAVPTDPEIIEGLRNCGPGSRRVQRGCTAMSLRSSSMSLTIRGGASASRKR